MIGTIFNSATIILGSLIGILIKKGIKEEYKNTIMDGIGLSVVIIGIIGGIKANNIILVICSIVAGSIIGEVIDIDKKLDHLGLNMEKRFGRGDSNFSKGFITASLIYCIGAMAIVGSLEAGLSGNYETLFVKSIIDGITAVIFASSLGIGVAFSAISVFLYQGAITMLASVAKNFLTTEVINEMSAVGGILIMAIGINLLEIKKIKVANMLLAIFIPLFYFAVVK